MVTAIPPPERVTDDIVIDRLDTRGRYRCRTTIPIPVVLDGEPGRSHGSLCVYYRDPGDVPPLTPERIESLWTLSAQAAVLFEERHRQSLLESTVAIRMAENDRRFRNLAMNALGVTCRFSAWPDGRVSGQIFGDGAADLLGIDPVRPGLGGGGMRGDVLENLIHPDDLPFYRSALQEAGGAMAVAFCWQGRLRHGTTGQIRWIRLSLSPEPCIDGTVIWDGVLTDVTERRDAQAALRESEERFRILAEAADDVVSLHNRRTGEILYVSPSVRQWAGFEPYELLGTAGLSYIHPEDRGSVVAVLRSIHGSRDSAGLVTWRVRRRDGTYGWMESKIKPLDTPSLSSWNSAKNGGLPDDFAVSQAAHVLVASRDVTEKHEREEEALRQSRRDPLTGLANRAQFLTLLDEALITAAAEETQVGVLFLDLDGFKRVNDMLGHATGDALLIRVAETLRAVLPPKVTLARLGGDEFILLAPALAASDEPRMIAETILETFRDPHTVAGHEFVVTASIGISSFPFDGRDAHALMRAADTAMYEAKAQGRNTYQLHTAAMNVSVYDRMLLQNHLSRAAEYDELNLEYQPQVSLIDGHIIGAEALLRWTHPKIGLVPSHRFIPLAEETGLIRTLGEWALRRACREAAGWFRSRRLLTRHATIAVNISARQLAHPGFVSLVSDVLAESGLPGYCLELELTESALIWNGPASVKTLDQLKTLGIRLSVDDFGTGYSSLSYLRRFPFDAVKIDHSFVAEMTADGESHAIVRGIIDLSHALGLRVVAEGVETPEQRRMLAELDCDAAQGWLFWPSLPGPDVAALFANAEAAEAVWAAATRTDASAAEAAVVASNGNGKGAHTKAITSNGNGGAPKNGNGAGHFAVRAGS